MGGIGLPSLTGGGGGGGTGGGDPEGLTPGGLIGGIGFGSGSGGEPGGRLPGGGKGGNAGGLAGGGETGGFMPGGGQGGNVGGLTGGGENGGSGSIPPGSGRPFVPYVPPAGVVGVTPPPSSGGSDCEIGGRGNGNAPVGNAPPPCFGVG